VRPTCDSVSASVVGSVSTAPSAPTIVTSRPSRIHVTPKAVTTSQCQRDHGSRSSRWGMLVWMGSREVARLGARSGCPAMPPTMTAHPAMHYPLPPTSHVRRYRLAQAECCVYLAAMIRVDQSRTLFTLAVLVAAL